MYTKLFCVFFIVSINHFANAQIIKIVDSEDKSPIQYATIFNSKLNYYKESNNLGEVDISDFNFEKLLCISLIGYNNFCFLNVSLQDQTIWLVRNDILMHTITIRGSKTNQNRFNLPAHIESINLSELVSDAPQTTADLIKNANGVFIQKSQQGGGSPIIRGFAANRILLVVDGVRLNNAIYRSGNLQNIISINPNGLEKVDVLLGPNSLIYGSDALGGVVHMHSQRGKFNSKFGGNILARYNSTNNELMYSLGLNNGNKNLHWSSHVSFSRLSDLRMGNHGPDEYLRDSIQLPNFNNIRLIDQVIVNPDPRVQKESGFNQFFTQQNVGLALNSYSTLDYSFYYSRTSDVPRYDRLIERRSGSLKNAVWNYGPQEWIMNRINYNSFKNGLLADELSIILALQLYKESRHDRRLFSENLRHRSEKVNIVSLNVDATKKGHHISTSYGLEWIYNRVKSKGNQENLANNESIMIQSRYPDNSTWGSIASYIQTSKAINNWNISGGLRYTYVRTRAIISNEFLDLPFTNIQLDNHAISGSLSINVVPTNNLFLYSNFSTGFRAPNIDDVGKVFDSEPGSVVVPNDQLKPEYIYGIEMGIQSRESAHFNFHVSAFYTYIDDLISRINSSFNGADSIVYDGVLSQIQSLQNADNGYIWGLEGKADFQFGNDNEISLSLNYQKGKENTSEGTFPLRHITPAFGHLSFSKKLDMWKIKTTLHANGSIDYENLAPSERVKSYIYAVDDQGNPFSPRWWTLDANVQYTFLNRLRVSGGFQNIFDKRYRTYSSGIAGPGRGVNLSLNFSFD